MLKYKAITLFLILAAQTPAFSQSVKTLSQEDCIEIALQKNPALSAQKNALDAALYKYKTTKNTLYYPSFNLSHSWNRSGNGSAAPALGTG